MIPSSSAVQLILLGTGGGRFATITQQRRTGGIRILHDKTNVHLDPGPGALVYSLKAGLDPQKINGTLVSHCHPDHCNDAEILVEAMTRGMTRKRGTLAAAHSALKGNQRCEASISKYHQQMPEQVINAQPDVSFNIGNLHVVATKARHTDPDTVGFRFETQRCGAFAYTSDSEYFEGIGAPYKGVRLLLLCLMRPSESPWKGHMTTEDAIKIVEEAQPEMTILTHFGMRMIFKGPANEARLIQQNTGIHTVAGLDGMRIRINREIHVTRPRRRQLGLHEFTETT